MKGMGWVGIKEKIFNSYWVNYNSFDNNKLLKFYNISSRMMIFENRE